MQHYNTLDVDKHLILQYIFLGSNGKKNYFHPLPFFLVIYLVFGIFSYDWNEIA